MSSIYGTCCKCRQTRGLDIGEPYGMCGSCANEQEKARSSLDWITLKMENAVNSKFSLNKEQREMFKEWAIKQLKKKDWLGATGARWIFSFVPTTVGTIIYVKDRATGDTLDIEDGSDF